MTESPAPPVLRVVRGGEPTAVEVAALVAVLSALPAGAPPEAPTPPAGGWADPAAGLRRPLVAGRGAWLASGRLPGTRTGA